MSDENENNDESTPRLQLGVHPVVAVIALFVGGLMGYLIPQHRPADDEAGKYAANVEIGKANAEFQKRMFQLQSKVVDECVKRNGVPTLNNGNVECKVEPKKP